MLLLGLVAVRPAHAVDYQPPGEEARCPVCGMFVAPHTNWTASIVFADGDRVYFDGPKDLFRYFFDLASYRADGDPGQIAAIFVTEYYSVRPMLAGDVYFVSGSDVLGPMGKELVPVAGLEKARTFMRDHGGVKLMHFDGTALSEVPEAE